MTEVEEIELMAVFIHLGNFSEDSFVYNELDRLTDLWSISKLRKRMKQADTCLDAGFDVTHEIIRKWLHYAMDVNYLERCLALEAVARG